MAKSKQAKLSSRPNTQKHVVMSPLEVARENPLWAFRDFDNAGRWSWSRIGEPDARKIMQRLKDYEGMTWTAIKQASHCHYVEPSEIHKDAQDRLLFLRKDETNSLFSMSIEGKKRIWGILQEHVLFLLWYDPEHEIYESKKR
jgi:hypothetical protein